MFNIILGMILLVVGIALLVEGLKLIFMSEYEWRSEKEFHPKIFISGPGVMHVQSSEILKSKEGKRQLAALKNLKDK